MKRNNKERLFEMMERVDPYFEPNTRTDPIRSTNSDSQELDLNKKYQQRQMTNKPVGLWYQIDDSWNEWCNSEMPHWVKEHNIIIDVNMADIIVFNDYPTEITAFSEKFKDTTMPSFYGDDEIRAIDWNRVIRESGKKGIEIPNIENVNHRDGKLSWIYGWDVDSGCIWDLSAIRTYRAENCDSYKEGGDSDDPYDNFY